jgi:hypothetical protein
MHAAVLNATEGSTFLVLLLQLIAPTAFRVTSPIPSATAEHLHHRPEHLCRYDHRPEATAAAPYPTSCENWVTEGT